MLRYLTFALAACAPVVADTSLGGEEDTGLSAPLPTISSPAAPELEQGRETYQEGQCPEAGLGAIVPKGAMIQAWACNGDACRAIPERLTVLRGLEYDEALLVTCAGSQRFELAWLAVLP